MAPNEVISKVAVTHHARARAKTHTKVRLEQVSTYITGSIRRQGIQTLICAFGFTGRIRARAAGWAAPALASFGTSPRRLPLR